MAAFQALSKAPLVDVVDEVMPIIFLSDKSACIMYDRTSTFRKVNDQPNGNTIPDKKKTIAITVASPLSE